jgi:hypothetical protein
LLLLTDSSLNLGNADLVKIALEVYLKLKDNFPWLVLLSEIEFATNYKPGVTSKEIGRAREKCPVCDGFVNFIDHSLFGVCDDGHVWGKILDFL